MKGKGSDVMEHLFPLFFCQTIRILVCCPLIQAHTLQLRKAHATPILNMFGLIQHLSGQICGFVTHRGGILGCPESDDRSTSRRYWEKHLHFCPNVWMSCLVWLTSGVLSGSILLWKSLEIKTSLFCLHFTWWKLNFTKQDY